MPEKLKKYIFLFPAVLLLLYTSIRAYRLSFTIDEASTFMYLCQGTYYDILHPHWIDANNHVLNTFAMKFFSSWLPLSEFTLRIQSVLAHAMYLVFTWLLLKNFKNDWRKLALYLILNLNPYMLDFFSMARGYAMSWALMTGSLFFLKCLLESKSRKFVHTTLAFLFAGFAVIANFTLLNYYIALLAFYLLYTAYHLLVHRHQLIKNPWFWASLAFAGLFSYWVFSFSLDRLYALKTANLLIWGGHKGFWADTMQSLVSFSNYSFYYPDDVYFLINFMLALIPTGCILYLLSGIVIRAKNNDKSVSFILFVKSRKRPGFTFFAAFIFLFFMVVAGITAQFYIFGTPFIVERAAIFVLIIFTFGFVFLVHHIRHELVANVLIPMVFLCCMFHFIRAFNTFYTNEWHMNADVKAMMLAFGKAEAQGGSSSKKDVSMQIQWQSASTCDFYKFLYHYDNLRFDKRNTGINSYADYYYISDTLLKSMNAHSVETMAIYPESHSSFLKNLRIKSTGIGFHKLVNMQDTIKNDPKMRDGVEPALIEKLACIKVAKGKFAPTYIYSLKNSSTANGLHVKAEAKLYFPSFRKTGDLAIALHSKDGKVLEWHSLKIQDDLSQNTGWITIPYELDFVNIPENAGEIKIFVWNTGNDDIYIANMTIDINEL